MVRFRIDCRVRRALVDSQDFELDAMTSSFGYDSCPAFFRRTVLTSQKTFSPKFEPLLAGDRSSIISASVLPSALAAREANRLYPRRPRLVSNCIPTRSGSGGNVGPQETLLLEDESGRGRPAAFSPRDQAIIKAIACETVAETGLPLSRSVAGRSDRAGLHYALGKPISKSTV